LQELNLSNTSITDVGLTHLGALTQLRELDLRYTAFQGNGFAHFDEMPDLNVVLLSDSRCGDGVAQLVSVAPRLAELHLARTPVTDVVMSALRGHANIVELDLSGTAITDQGVSILGRLPNLSKLRLDGTSITGSGFRDLEARRLEQLYLESSPISDESLSHLKRFPRLYSIFLNDTPIGDNALFHLAGKFFSELQLAGTRVTAQGLLHAHFDAGELTLDDQQGSDAERAAVEEMYETVIVVPKNSELESEQPAVAGE
jgi:Leucine-rich repeat (LRR) protein